MNFDKLKISNLLKTFNKLEIISKLKISNLLKLLNRFEIINKLKTYNKLIEIKHLKIHNKLSKFKFLKVHKIEVLSISNNKYTEHAQYVKQTYVRLLAQKIEHFACSIYSLCLMRFFVNYEIVVLMNLLILLASSSYPALCTAVQMLSHSD